MAKSTIENRIYLFDTLAGALLSGPVGDLLASTDVAERERALRALADAAWVSCVVADAGELGAEDVRARLLGVVPEGKRGKKDKAGKKDKREKGDKRGKADEDESESDETEAKDEDEGAASEAHPTAPQDDAGSEAEQDD